MSIFDKAKKLASMGFYIFPLLENTKIPLIKDYTNLASCDPTNLETYWLDKVMGFEHYHNIGIATSRFKDGQALLVVDVDNKKGKNGSQVLVELELKGFEFPKTLTQKTPTGGFHLIYKVKTPVKQGTDVLGKGLDIRSRGGLIVGAGSLIDNQPYLINNSEIVDAPKWMIDKCNEKREAEKERKAKNKPAKKIDQKTAKERALDYLINHAVLAVEGAGGDETTFIVANKLKDLGVNEKNCLNLMLDNWNERCQPPWDIDNLKTKIDNAYSYGQNTIGIDSPENDFSPVVAADETLSPIEKLNKEFAFIVLGGKSTILRQEKEGPISFMNVQAFHDLLKPDTIIVGKSAKQVSELWFSSHSRPTYKGAEMHPSKNAPAGIYNLWRGFNCEPLGKNERPTKDMIEGVRLFKEHALENICLNDEKLLNWLMGYFAHMIQKPWEKPLTALVFKGSKGVGKNALIDRVGNLFRPHYKVVSNKRYLLSNFNGHLARLILMVLDEAFWSGDKQAEGILKDLITGNEHQIEHKGREVFSVKNLLRICIIGNEDWVIPASEDERRFAVFNIGDARQTDKPYFKKMRKLIDTKGGNRLLLRELLAFDLESIDVNEAPDTIGLLEQKIQSLDPIHSWWFSCLKEGDIYGMEFQRGWPESVGRSQLRDAYLIYAKGRGIRSWLPDASSFGRIFQKGVPDIRSKRARSGTDRTWSYIVPNIHDCREKFEQFIRHKITWEEDEYPSNVIDAINIFS